MTKGRQWLLALILVAGTARAVSPQDQDVGQVNFRMSCASCHGAEGKGNGPVSGQLKAAARFDGSRKKEQWCVSGQPRL